MNNTDTNTRGEHRSTLKSNPREPMGDIRIGELADIYTNGTIVENMDRIMQLVEDNKKLRSRR